MEIQAPTSILQLPLFLTHNILSLLPPRDAVRASATSRQWRSAWTSSPFLDFDEKSVPFKNSDFLDYIDRSVSLWRRRCADNRVSVQRLSISAALTSAGEDLDSISSPPPPILADLIAFAAARGVKAVEIHNRGAESCLALYDAEPLWNSLCACQVLDVLSLKSFELHFTSSSPNMISSSLRRLVLDFGYITNNSLHSLLSNFPLLEHLTVNNVIDLTEIRVSLKSLKTMTFSSIEDHKQTLFVEAPNLHSFSYSKGFGLPLDDIKFSNCQSLTTLRLDFVRFDQVGSIDELVSQIPGLENLVLEACQVPAGVQVTHRNLKSLKLRYCWGFSGAEIDTPSLSRFCYLGRMCMFSRFRFFPGSLDVDVGVGAMELEWFWLVKLRNILESFSNCNVLKLTCYTEGGFSEELKDNNFLPDPFYETTYLEIHYSKLSISNYARFVEIMFELFPCAQTLSVKASCADVTIKYDEFGYGTFEWIPYVKISDPEYGRTLESINAAMDEAMTFLGFDCETEEDTTDEKKNNIPN